MNGLYRVLFALALFAGAASAQNTPFTISNLTFSGATSASYQNSGSGTAMFPGLASGTVPFTLSGVEPYPCGPPITISETLTFDSSDTLTLTESFPANCTSPDFTVSTSFTVTGGTGVYSGVGGSGTLTFITQSNQKNGVGPFSATGSGSGTLTPHLTPTVPPGGIVPVYSTVPTIQPGEWVSIYGTGLASSTVTWNGNFPTSLGGTSVTIDGKPAYLWYASPGQINLQAPADSATGSVPVVVTTASGSFTSTVTLAPVAPSFSLLDSEHVAGIILRSDGSGAYGGGTYDILGPTGTSLGYATVAARAGDSVVLFAVGLGPTNPVVPPGQAYSSAAPTVSPVSLLINSVSVTPTFAGLSSAGLYQINLTVPAGIGSGDVALQASTGGAQTQAGVVFSLTGSTVNPTLTVTTLGSGSGNITSSPTGTSCGSGCLSFVSGTAVTLTATPGNGSTFGGWSGACTGTGSCAVTMTSNQTVIATFNLSAAATSVTGTAAVGLPAAGSLVTIKDSAGKSSTSTTAGNGSYTLNTTGMTPPFLVQVQTGGGNLYSVSADALTSTTINTHPFTDLIIRSWYSAQGQSVDSAFANPVSLPAPSPASVQLINNQITNLAQLWLGNAGVNTAQFNMISTAFAANGTGLDQVLDETTVNTGSGKVTIAAGGTTQTSTITYNTSASTMTVASSTTSSHGTSVSSISTVVPTQAAQQAALTSIGATWAAITNAVASNGSQLTAAELTPFLAADLLDDGLNQSQFAASLATSLRGLTASSIQIASINSIDLVHGLADVVFKITVAQGGVSQTKPQEFWFENVAGTWLIGGDKRIAQVYVSAQTQLREGAQSGSGPLILTQAISPTGTVSGVTVTDASGVTGFNSTPLQQTSEIVETLQPTPTTTLTLNLDNFGLNSNFPLSGGVPAGTLFTFALTPKSGPVVNYALPSNVFTTEPISITSPTSGVLASYTLGQPLTVNWTLPTTFAVAQVKLDANVFTGSQTSPSTLSCQTNGTGLLATNATSGTITIPATCSGMPAVQVNLFVGVTGVDGEFAQALLFIQ